MLSRKGVILRGSALKAVKRTEITLAAKDANLDGARFENMIIRRYENLIALRNPVPPELESSYSIGSSGIRREPTIDAYYRMGGNRRMLVEIKKGFKYIDGYPLICTSKEQLKTLATCKVKDGNVEYIPGEYWVFVRQSNQYKNKNQKFSFYRISNDVVRYLHSNVERLMYEVPDAVRV